MRGIELTEEHIQAARQFCIESSNDGKSEMPDDDELIGISFGQLARLVAWYGAIRFKEIRLSAYRECKEICLANGDESADEISQLIYALEHPEFFHNEKRDE